MICLRAPWVLALRGRYHLIRLIVKNNYLKEFMLGKHMIYIFMRVAIYSS